MAAWSKARKILQLQFLGVDCLCFRRAKLSYGHFNSPVRIRPLGPTYGKLLYVKPSASGPTLQLSKLWSKILHEWKWVFLELQRLCDIKHGQPCPSLDPLAIMSSELTSDSIKGFDEDLPVTHHNEYVVHLPSLSPSLRLTLTPAPQHIPRHRPRAVIRRASYSGKVVLVTGASRGVGRKTALHSHVRALRSRSWRAPGMPETRRGI